MMKLSSLLAGVLCFGALQMASAADDCNSSLSTKKEDLARTCQALEKPSCQRKLMMATCSCGHNNDARGSRGFMEIEKCLKVTDDLLEQSTVKRLVGEIQTRMKQVPKENVRDGNCLKNAVGCSILERGKLNDFVKKFSEGQCQFFNYEYEDVVAGSKEETKNRTSNEAGFEESYAKLRRAKAYRSLEKKCAALALSNLKKGAAATGRAGSDTQDGHR